jgi:hypothetical protein
VFARDRKKYPSTQGGNTDMALLDMQALELNNDREWHGGGGGGNHSGLSLLLCDSTASVTLCL